MAKLKQTPSQTVGPFFAYGLTARQYGYNFSSLVDGNLRGDDFEGEAISISGRVLDGEGAPIHDAMVEIWQADSQGNFPGRNSNSAFKGLGRLGTGTDPHCRFHFQTVMPGSVGDGQAPHISVIVFMRGLLNHNHTRIYFEGHCDNDKDIVLQAVPKDRRHTLLARKVASSEWQFDIHMQGENETVFFDF